MNRRSFLRGAISVGVGVFLPFKLIDNLNQPKLEEINITGSGFKSGDIVTISGLNNQNGSLKRFTVR